MSRRSLSKKMQTLMKEKVDLESALEREQEYVVNKLQRQMAQVNEDKRQLEKKLQEGNIGLIEQMEQAISRIRSGSFESDNNSPSTTPTCGEEARLLSQLQEMGREIRLLKAAQNSNERRFSERINGDKEQEAGAAEELQRLRHQNYILGQKIIREAEKFEELKHKNANLESYSEFAHERIFNITSAPAPGTTSNVTARRHSSRTGAALAEAAATLEHNAGELDPQQRVASPVHTSSRTTTPSTSPFLGPMSPGPVPTSLGI